MKDYARFCQMPLNSGKLDDLRIIGQKTLQFMTTGQLGPKVKTPPQILPGRRFGPGFAVRTQPGMAPFAGSVGQYYCDGIAGTFFFVDPREGLFGLFMSQAPASDYFRAMTGSVIFAARED